MKSYKKNFQTCWWRTPPMENFCHVFLQKHSVPKDLGNNYAVKKINTEVRHSIKFDTLFFAALEYHSVSNTSNLFLFISFFSWLVYRIS